MIGRIRSVVRQLRGRSTHELYSRAAQRAFALGERASLRVAGSGNSRPPAFDADTVFSRPFFPGVNTTSSSVRDTVAMLRAHVPGDERDVLARATAAERGDVQLFGRGTVHLGTTPDWQLDPFANIRAPQQHWSTFNYLDRNVVGDHKVVWEINRHQYFVTLGQAYAYTRDERWPKAFVRLLDGWIAGNPPTIGMNWCSSLEVSYRAISWLWALQLMRNSPTVDTGFKSRVLGSLQAHGRHLERYLSTYFSPNTHLTGEALGLFYIGTQCPELPRAAHWASLGASILEDALDRQVLRDGVYFEQATQYHRYTIDIYLQYWLLARQLGRRTDAKVEAALQRMFDVLLHITRGDGTYPLIGDDDGGRLLQLDSSTPDDARALLATGAVLFNRHDLAWMGRGDDAALCWMLGGSAVAQRDALVTSAPQETAKAFPAGGMYTMRSGWSMDASLAVIDAGPHGALSFGHSHADPLAVDLSVGGKPLFVDAGTFTYVGDERNTFRSTAAHNTVEVDATSTSIPGTAFRWQKVSNATATDWAALPEFSYFAGAQDGYHSLPDPVRHERSVLHDNRGIWVVRDTLVSKARHGAVVRWHCAPGVEPRAQHRDANQLVFGLHEGGRDRALLLMAGGRSGAAKTQSSWVSGQFGRKVEASVCEWHEQFDGNAVLTSVVIDMACYRVAVTAGNGLPDAVAGAQAAVVLEAVDDSSTEQVLVVVGGGRSFTYGTLSLDADIALLRISPNSGRLLGVVGAGVRHATHDAAAWITPGTATSWIVASNDSNGADDAWAVKSGSTTLPSTT